MVNNIGKKVFIGGIGGISTSGIALLLLNKGHIVSGSEIDENNEFAKELEKRGVKIYYNQSSDNIKKERPDTYIYSYAISPDNEERCFAQKTCKQVLGRGEALGVICKDYNRVVAVSGSHGKTTTTSILSYIFYEAKLNPTIHIGGVAKNINSNFMVGGNSIFITEACEYHNSFLNIQSFVSVILNVQNDHMDFFKTQENLQKSFLDFANKTMAGGYVCLNLDDPICKEFILSKKIDRTIKTFSIYDNSADAYAKNIHIDRTSSAICFDAVVLGEEIKNIKLNMVGRHNVYNALVGILVARLFNIDVTIIKKALWGFSGIKRRFEFYGKLNGATVIHDYAHHPTEIETVINEARVHFKKNIIVVFEPHTYTRTKSLWKAFSYSLGLADKIILCPIYPAREKPIKGVTSYILSLSVKNYNKNSIYVKNYEELKKYLIQTICADDVVLVLGAGNIVHFLDKFDLFDKN